MSEKEIQRALGATKKKRRLSVIDALDRLDKTRTARDSLAKNKPSS
jgi:hypothetical protein